MNFLKIISYFKFYILISSIILLRNSVEATYNQNILNGLKDLKEQCRSLRRQLTDIKTSLPTLTIDISEALQMDPLVILQLKKLDTAQKNGNPVNKCQEIFDIQYKWVVDKLHEYVSNKINDNLMKLQDSLKYIEENRVDGFINTMKTGQPSESDIRNIIEESDKDLYIVDRLQYEVRVLVQNTLYDLDKAPASDIIKDNLLKPTFECFSNSEITESQKK